MSCAIGKAHGKNHTKTLQALWDDLLSRQPERVKSAYDTLDPSEQQAVRLHLQRMANEEGWLLEQRVSAQAALCALQARAE